MPFKENVGEYSGIYKSEDEIVQWFALSATFGRALKAKEFLEENQVECFVPLHYEIHERRGKKIRKLVPVIRNLLFAHTTKQHIQQLKANLPYLHYLTCTLEGKTQIITVPLEQMEQFIRVCNTYSEHVIYLSPDEITLSKGTRVKIIGGIFDGVEGEFVKVNNHRNRQVIIEVQGVTSVMLAKVTGGFIQVLE